MSRHVNKVILFTVHPCVQCALYDYNQPTKRPTKFKAENKNCKLEHVLTHKNDDNNIYLHFSISLLSHLKHFSMENPFLVS